MWLLIDGQKCYAYFTYFGRKDIVSFDFGDGRRYMVPAFMTKPFGIDLDKLPFCDTRGNQKGKGGKRAR